MKKALLVVSFGTSYPVTLKRNIEAIEQAMREAFPDRVVYRAFTSGFIRRKLLRRDGVRVDGVVEALEELHLDKYEDVLIQPTHMINGEETERLMAEVDLYAHVFRRLRVGKPLLTDQQDYEALVDAIMAELPELKDDEALVLMGHGTKHHANPAYPALEYVFHALGHKNVFVGTVEGYPPISEVIARLDETLNVRRVYLTPLMVVAGDHANKDMVGNDSNSWINRITAAHYYPIPIMRGLGEYKGVRQMFVDHARAALQDE